MDLVSSKVLQTVHGLLEQLTLADNLTGEQLTEISMAATALGYQVARMQYPVDALERSHDAEAKLAGSVEVTALRPRRAAPDFQTFPGARLCAAIEAGALAEDRHSISQIRQLLVDYHSPMDPVIDAGTRAAYAGGRGDASSRAAETVLAELSSGVLERWLHKSGRGSEAIKVVKLRRLMGGYSKATFIVETEDNGAQATFVIRKDSPGLPTGSSVTSEFPVLQEMSANGVPVPQPLWIECDATVGNGAFMGMKFCNGTPANQTVPSDPDRRRKWASSTAEVLSRLHVGTAMPQADIRETLYREIEALEERMLEREREPHPGLLIGFNWLRRHMDWLEGRPACRIHGDVGFHNMLMENDHISALLDWEFSRIGDPVEDLASIKPFMDQIENWDSFYQAYRSGGGFTLDHRAESYFAVWQETRNMVACLGSLNSLLLPGVLEVPLTVAGTIYIPKFEIAIFDAIAKAEKWDV